MLDRAGGLQWPFPEGASAPPEGEREPSGGCQTHESEDRAGDPG